MRMEMKVFYLLTEKDRSLRNHFSIDVKIDLNCSHGMLDPCVYLRTTEMRVLQYDETTGIW